MRRRRARKRLQKPPSPRHTLALLGRLIRRRIETSTIYSKGVSLVNNLHLGWRDKTQVTQSGGDGSGADGEAMKDKTTVTNEEPMEELPTDSDATPPSGSSTEPPEAEMTSHQLTPSVSGESEHRGIDTNINAIRHVRPGHVHGSRGKRGRNKRRLAKGRRLVARSIGGPKHSINLRPKRALLSRHSASSKRSKKLRMLRWRLDKLKDDVELIASSLTEELEGPARETTTRKDDGQDSEAASVTHQLESASPAPGEDTEEHRREQRVSKTRKLRTRRKTVDLINMFEAGPSHSVTENNKDRGKYPRKKKLYRKPDATFGKSSSRLSTSSSSHLHAHGSSENLDWPSLPASGRPKGLVKEKAKKIVRSKQSKSITGLSRRRWADIVTSRTKENARLDERQSTSSAAQNVFPMKTWASVASSSARSDPMEGTHFMSGERVSPVFSRSSNGCECCANKKKNESKFTSSDKSLPGGQGRPQALRGRPKKNPDCFDQCLKLKAAKARSSMSHQQSSVQSGSDHIQSRDSQHGASNEQRETSSCDGGLKETKRDGPCNWCIDNMSVVYTKPVANVISLKAPLEARTKRMACGTKQMNCCNNRTVTPSKTREGLNLFDDEREGVTSPDPTTSLELCDRLSMVSFQSTSEVSSIETAGPSRCKTRGGYSPRIKASKQKRLANPVHQKEVSRAALDEAESKPKKKISLKYRALLRGENGRLDAKTVTEMSSRSKKTDSMQEDKLANRTLQRRQRQRRQQTSHNLQRSPALAAERRASRSSDAKPRVVLGGAAATNISAARADGASTSKQGDEINKSGNSWVNTANQISTRNRMVLSPTALKAPDSASSAPDLSWKQNKICLELHTIGIESIDIGWWHAYLDQNPETACQCTDGSSTSQTL